MISPILPAEGPNYRNIISQSFRFLFLQHAFRYATEEGTRRPHASVPGGYVDSVNNLHGWADGDSFIVNYVGHPMEGGVAGNVWIQNDRKYRYVQFGKNRDYWRSRLRAGGFAFLYSIQFEIGPLSEASMGATQKYFPQQGFVDHVVTPSVGLGWIIAEDALDKYLIQWAETRTANPYYKLLLRGALNPTRSLANVLAGELPWHRQSRGGVFGSSALPTAYPVAARVPENSGSKPAPFEMTIAPAVITPVASGGSGPCIGGGGEAAIRLSSNAQIVTSVTGCKLTAVGANTSGDMLLFLVGPRFVTSFAGKWSPYVQLLVGGTKVTTEEMYPAVKAALAASLAQFGRKLDFTDHDRYTRQSDTTGFAMSFGTGLSRKLNEALAWEVASIEYTHGWTSRVEGLSFRNVFEIKSGLTLKMGTW